MSAWARFASMMLATVTAAACSQRSQPSPNPPDHPASAPASFSDSVTGHGRPVIFLPGLGGPPAMWDGTVSHLGGRVEAHVLAIAGFAGKPPIGGPLSATVRRELAAYIRDRGLHKPIIVGHSLGGFIGYWLAATEPDLLGGLVVVDAAPFDPASEDETATPERMEPIARQLRAHWASMSAAEFKTQFRKALTGLVNDPASIEPIVEAAVHSDRRTVGDAFYEALTTDLRGDVAHIGVPVLVILSDGPSQQQIKHQVAAIPYARVVVLPGTRHLIMYDDPDGFFRALDGFLFGDAR